MATGPEDHFEQARHNERLLEVFESDILPRFPEFLDWAIVLVFYAALHYTKGAILRDLGASSKTHRTQRREDESTLPGHNDLVREHFDENVAAAYRELFDRSQEARYRPYYRKAKDADSVRNLIALMRFHLETIKAAALP